MSVANEAAAQGGAPQTPGRDRGLATSDQRARRSMRAPLALLAGLAIAVAGCGGTNSETPWPVAPDDVDLGPEGETRRNEELAGPRPAAAPAATSEPAAPAPATT